MIPEIFQGWSEVISKKRYFPAHFVAQQPNLARDFLSALVGCRMDLIALLPSMIAYTENSPLKPREFLESLFLLRDLYVQSKLKITSPDAEKKRNFLENLEECIIKLSTYFTHLKADLRNGMRDRHSIDSPQIEDCAFQLDENFCLKNFNGALLAKFHCRRADILGKPFSCLFSKTSHTLLDYAREEFVEHRRLMMELEAQAITLNGKKFRCHLNLKRIDNPDAKNFLSGTIKDITYIQETQSLLNLMSMALESVGEGIVITQNDRDAKILYVNYAFERLSGYKKFQLMGHPLNILRKSRSSEKNWVVAANRPDLQWQGEAYCRHKSGGVFPVQIHSQPVKDENGNILARVSILRDLTVSRAREKEIRDLQKFIENIINNLHHAVVVTDDQFQIRYGNSTVQQNFVVPNKGPEKKYIYEVIPELRELCTEELLPKLTNPGAGLVQKKYLKSSNNSSRYYSVSVSSLPSEKGNGLLLWDLEDIDEEEKLREQITLQNSRLATLESLASALNRCRERGQIAALFSEQLHGMLEFSYLDIFVTMDVSESHLQKIYSDHPLDFSDLQTTLSLEEFDLVCSSKEWRARELANDSDRINRLFDVLKYKGANHLLFLPIFFAEEFIGAVFLGHYKKISRDEDELEFLSQVSAHLGLALRNNQHLEQMNARNIRFSLVNQIFALTQTQHQPKQFFDDILHKIAEFLPDHSIALYHKTDIRNWSLLSQRNSANKFAQGNCFPEKIEFENPETDDEIIYIEKVCEPPVFGHLMTTLEFSEAPAGSLFCSHARYFGDLLLIVVRQIPGPVFDYKFRHYVLQEMFNEIAYAIDQSTLFEKTMKGQQEWQLTFDALGIGVAILDGQSNILRANSAFWEIFEEMEGSFFNYQEITTERSWKVVDGTEGNLSKIPVSERVILYDEKRAAYYSQRYFPLPDSLPGSGIITLKEITEEREKDDHIRYLSQFPESNPNLVISINKQDEIQYINPALEKFLAEQKMTPSEFRKHLPENLIAEFLTSKDETLAPAEFQLQMGDLTFQFIAKASSENRFLYLFGMDITDQLQMQGQLIQSARLRAMGEMASGIAHDFNNLLATILGRTQLLQMKNQDSSLVDELSVIERAAQEGGEIVKKLQDSTKTNRVKHFKPIYLSDIIEHSLQYSTQKIKINTQVKGCIIDIQKQLEEDVIVFGNPVELKEMFTNLFFNAYDAMPEGGKILIKTRKANSKKAEIIIRDSGAGIPEEIIHRIFDPFFTTKGDLGTGLGLNMVYNIITAHRGKIEVNSVLGQGTEFRIELPISKDLPKNEIKDNRMGFMEFSQMRLLVVDDEPELLNTMAEILRLKFKRVDMAGAGDKALELIRKNDYQVVLTDLGMPEISGWEVAREAKKKNPQTKTVLVTGWGMQAEDELGHHKHVDSIISKPYDLVKLFETLREINSSEPQEIEDPIS